MVYIFSNMAIKGLSGKYLNEKYFDGGFEEDVDVVYTDNKEIAKLATEKGIEVIAITKSKKTSDDDDDDDETKPKKAGKQPKKAD